MKRSTEKSPKVKKLPNLICSVMTASPFETILLIHKFDFGSSRYVGEFLTFNLEIQNVLTTPKSFQFSKVGLATKTQITNIKDETFDRKVSESEERAQLDLISDDSKSFRNSLTSAKFLTLVRQGMLVNFQVSI